MAGTIEQLASSKQTETAKIDTPNAFIPRVSSQKPQVRETKPDRLLGDLENLFGGVKSVINDQFELGDKAVKNAAMEDLDILKASANKLIVDNSDVGKDRRDTAMKIGSMLGSIRQRFDSEREQDIYDSVFNHNADMMIRDYVSKLNNEQMAIDRKVAYNNANSKMNNIPENIDSSNIDTIHSAYIASGRTKEDANLYLVNSLAERFNNELLSNADKYFNNDGTANSEYNKLFNNTFRVFGGSKYNEVTGTDGDMSYSNSYMSTDVASVISKAKATAGKLAGSIKTESSKAQISMINDMMPTKFSPNAKMYSSDVVLEQINKSDLSDYDKFKLVKRYEEYYNTDKFKSMQILYAASKDERFYSEAKKLQGPMAKQFISDALDYNMNMMAIEQDEAKREVYAKQVFSIVTNRLADDKVKGMAVSIAKGDIESLSSYAEFFNVGPIESVTADLLDKDKYVDFIMQLDYFIKNKEPMKQQDIDRLKETKYDDIRESANDMFNSVLGYGNLLTQRESASVIGMLELGLNDKAEAIINGKKARFTKSSYGKTLIDSNDIFSPIGIVSLTKKEDVMTLKEKDAGRDVFEYIIDEKLRGSEFRNKYSEADELVVTKIKNSPYFRVSVVGIEGAATNIDMSDFYNIDKSEYESLIKNHVDKTFLGVTVKGAKQKEPIGNGKLKHIPLEEYKKKLKQKELDELRLK